jgi:flagellar biosynthesis/type III secretory pathway protein FliH
MKKYSRRERKIANIAKQEGYMKGYQQGYQLGLHDGNPFILLSEAIGKVISASLDTLKDPAFIEACKEAQEVQEKIDSCVFCDHFGDCEDCERSEEE